MQEEMFVPEKLPISDIKDYLLKRLSYFDTYEAQINYLRNSRHIYKEINDPDNEEVIQAWNEILRSLRLRSADIFLKSTQINEKYSYIEVDKLNSTDRGKLFEFYRFTFAAGCKMLYSDADKDYLLVDKVNNRYTWCENGDLFGELPSQKDIEDYFTQVEKGN